jgi:hypothetical protein
MAWMRGASLPPQNSRSNVSFSQATKPKKPNASRVPVPFCVSICEETRKAAIARLAIVDATAISYLPFGLPLVAMVRPAGHPAKLGSALSAFRIVLPICDGVTLVAFRTPIAHRELPVLEGFHVGNFSSAQNQIGRQVL